MNIYLSGPMTGYPDYNYPLFNAVAKGLREKGHDVYNPAEYAYKGPLDEFPVREAFAEYTEFICLYADAIAVLPGWEKSEGAKAEIALARVLGLEVIDAV